VERDEIYVARAAYERTPGGESKSQGDNGYDTNSALRRLDDVNKSSADTTLKEGGMHIHEQSCRDASLQSAGGQATANDPDPQPAKRFCYRNITVPSDHFSFDVETESGHIKWSGPMSEF